VRYTNRGAAIIGRKARYSLIIEILAYIRRPPLGRYVPLGILPCCLVRKTRMVCLPDGENIDLSVTLIQLFDVEYYRDREIWVRSHSKSFKLVPL